MKALAVSARQRGDLTLGCDTLVVLGNKTLGKPASREEAMEMLCGLSNRTHRVLTGLAWAKAGRVRAAEWVETHVTFDRIPRRELHFYLSTAEPYDKAGAYGIQGFAGRWVRSLDGDFFNVMGLPVGRVLQHLWIFRRDNGFKF
jgi:septum formation protein